jgi:hypothetical protein
MFRLKVLAIIVALLGLSIGSAHAQQTPTAPASPAGAPPAAQSYTAPAPYSLHVRETRKGYRRHDGLFLRMTTGGGVGATTYKERASDGSASRTRTLGGAALTEIAVGWAVMENLILHGTLSLAHQSSVKKYGSEPYSDDEASTLLGFFGAGATYYFMPANVYVTGSIGLGGLSQTSGHDHEDFESNTGFGTSIAIGKEWWIGRSGDWAIGGAIVGSYFQAPFEIDGVKSTYRGHNTGLAFTATYN